MLERWDVEDATLRRLVAELTEVIHKERNGATTNGDIQGAFGHHLDIIWTSFCFSNLKINRCFFVVFFDVQRGREGREGKEGDIMDFEEFHAKI